MACNISVIAVFPEISLLCKERKFYIIEYLPVFENNKRFLFKWSITEFQIKPVLINIQRSTLMHKIREGTS